MAGFPRSVLLLLPFIFLAFLPCAQGQVPPLPTPPASPTPSADPSLLFRFELKSAEGGALDVAENGQAEYRLMFTDYSKDGPGGLVGNVTPGGGSPFVHHTSFQVEYPHTGGWVVLKPADIISTAGDKVTVPVRVQLARDPANEVFFSAYINGTTRPAEESLYEFKTSIQISFTSKGIAGYEVLSVFNPDLSNLRPRQVAQVGFQVTNGLTSPRLFDAKVQSNSCNIPVGDAPTIAVGAKATQKVYFTISGPTEKFWYYSENCQLSVAIRPQDNPTAVKTVTVGITANGFSVDPFLVFELLMTAAAIWLLIFLIRRRRERRDEELLGKPQKPWLIPAEAVYLERLKQKDHRAWYIVRHHLMEEEYRSALLWYASYKAATKGTREKEHLVLKQERAYDKWRAEWQARIEEPAVEADKYDAKLQKKLDRKAKKRFKKAVKAARKDTKDLAKAHAKKAGRAQEAYEKAVRKAEKKGLPTPAKPAMTAADQVPEPELIPIPLASHRWAKRSARRHARALRKVGDLEVRFERADARRLARVQRKVQKLARKLDDPDFVAQHPLLQSH